MKLRTDILLFVVLLIGTLAVADESAPALLAAGRADDAISSLRSKINSSPNDGEAYNLLAAHISLWETGMITGLRKSGRDRSQ